MEESYDSRLIQRELVGSTLTQTRFQGRWFAGCSKVRFLGGQNLVTRWEVAKTGWAFAHPTNLLAEALKGSHLPRQQVYNKSLTATMFRGTGGHFDQNLLHLYIKQNKKGSHLSGFVRSQPV